MGENELRKFADLLLCPLRQEMRDQRQETNSRFNRIEETLEKHGDKLQDTAQKTAVIVNDIFAIKKRQDEARTEYEKTRTKSTSFLADALKMTLSIILSIAGAWWMAMYVLHQAPR